MQMSALRLPLAALVLTAAAVPAFAGNYAEGDPRPVALSSSVSGSAVAADTRAWMASAPTVGYPEGNPRAVVQVQENTRAAVQADTMNWIKSGLASVQFGEAGADPSRPTYRQAAQAYAEMRNASPGAKTSQNSGGASALVR
ncbi:hypothetical protein ACQ858_13550 [Variovorax ureilyticus]|uniref:hypothetical protein n=1 Tax=Variovorax ureilyticus TaxID=1836198 RepID=UPI003D67B422